jgi:hypothetical protein
VFVFRIIVVCLCMCIHIRVRACVFLVGDLEGEGGARNKPVFACFTSAFVTFFGHNCDTMLTPF